MFVDEIEIKLIAGSGGDGCTSFRREKFVPLGGPDGGNGGRGSNIVFEVDKGLKTLVDLRYKKIIKGNKGINGKGSNRNGKNQEDIIVKVPLGTTIINKDTNLVIADLVEENQRVIVAHGGRGGRGNKAFVTKSEVAPKFSEYGELGEVKNIRCELKVLADIGLIGLPSVGKSTILSVISQAKPKIASFHFTTLNPNLGVVKCGNQSFTIADLPGLIKGSSEGVGLGIKFLKHAMRSKVLAHVIDMGSEELRNPVEDYKVIRDEIIKYSEKLAKKEEIIIANKMDLPQAKSNLEKFKKVYPHKKIIPISAQEKKGLTEMIDNFSTVVNNTNAQPLYDEAEFESFALYKYEEENPYTVINEDGVWILKGEKIKKLFQMTKFNEEEAVERFARKLRKMGVEDALEKAGAKRGDQVQIEGYMFEFKE